MKQDVFMEPDFSLGQCLEEGAFPDGYFTIEQKEASIARKLKEYLKNGFKNWRKDQEFGKSYDLWIPPLI